MKKASSKRRAIWILVGLTLALILFTILVTLQQEGATQPRPHILHFIALIVALAVGFLIATAVFTKKELERLALDESNYSISEALLRIVWENKIEIVLLLIFTVFASFNLAAYFEDFAKMKKDSFGPTIIALLLTLVSTLITVIGMYYAFLAERKSADTLRNSIALLGERGEFLEHFSGFIQRINRKTDQLIEDIKDEQKNEKRFYFVKCIFLTPFLGHAGITNSPKPANKQVVVDFNKFQENMASLIDNPRCEVQILTLSPKELIKWYGHVVWVEQAKNEVERLRKPLTQFSEQERNVIIDRAKEDLLQRKGTGALDINGVGTVLSFTDHCGQYKTLFQGDTQKNPKLQICHVKFIPFQLFLVTQAVIEDPEKFPARGSFKKLPGCNIPVEDGRFLVLSFVGDMTYYNLIEDMLTGEDQRNNEGVEGLLKNLHSAFYSEDPRMCRILDNHFRHLWRECLTTVVGEPTWETANLHYPQVPAELWQTVKFGDEE